jgi:hypothetical protein
VRAPVALLLLAAAALAQDIDEVRARYLAQEEEAFGHYRRKDYAKAVEAFERQIAIFPDNPRPHYNIACCYALQGDAARAGTWLTLAVDGGWRDAAHLAHDPDFDRVRQSADYIASLAKLKRSREMDPDPMPRIVPAPEAPSSLRVAIALSQREEKAIRRMRSIHGDHQFRKRLFDALDRRMAVLARYIAENGDARDAGDAATARVATAALYLAEGRGEPDRELCLVAAAYILRTAEEFLRGYPGDPRLPGVLLARAFALRTLRRDAEAIALLRTVRADHRAQAAQADAELCTLLPAGDELKEARARLGDQAPVRARLLCDGMPSILDLDEAVAARVAAHGGLVAYVFVAEGDPESELLLEQIPDTTERLLPIVVCIDAGPDSVWWLSEHARTFLIVENGAEAARRLGGVPQVVVARKDGTVVAIDPDAAELARLSR